MEGQTQRDKLKLNRRRNGPSRHAVGDAAQASAGSGTDTEASSDWMAERRVGEDDKDSHPDGVGIDTSPTGDVHRGRAQESKRGQR